MAALRIALDKSSKMEERDRMAMENIMYELSAPMNLSEDVRSRIENPPMELPTPGARWKKNGAVLESGTRFRFSYKQTEYEGRIIDGKWILGKQRFDTPNRMLKKIIPRTQSGKETVINSWLFIEVNLLSSNEWVKLDSLRKRISRRWR